MGMLPPHTHTHTAPATSTHMHTHELHTVHPACGKPCLAAFRADLGADAEILARPHHCAGPVHPHLSPVLGCLCVCFCLLLSHTICSRQSGQTSSLFFTNPPVAGLQASHSRCLGPHHAFGGPIPLLPLVLGLLSLHLPQGLFLSVSGPLAGAGSSCPSAWNSLGSEDLCFTGNSFPFYWESLSGHLTS